MTRNQQIRDRVAFGDDLFRLENQADGRVRLVPSPNQVTTQGTDVNAELMQPWEDMLTAATRGGLVQLGTDAGGMPELRIPQFDSLSSAVVSTTNPHLPAKTAALPGFMRRTGSTVWVRFSDWNNAINPTLNINNTGAAAIHLNGIALNDANLARQLAANVLYGFVFDGTVWQMIVPGSSQPSMGQGFGTVATAANTAAKVGAIYGFTRRTGSVVWLRFTHHNTSASPTLNVNETGAAAIQFDGRALPGGAIVANGLHGFVFDGTSWQLINPAPHVMNGFQELGLPETASLVEVINAIRALPLTHPVSMRFSIGSAAIAAQLRAPLNSASSMMKIERAHNQHHDLALTYLTGTDTANGLRVFVANHRNVAATVASVDAIVWREIPQLNNGRLALGQLPTSTAANRVVAVGAANSNPAFMQVNSDMMAGNSVGTVQIQDNSVTTAKIADLAVTNAKIANNTIQLEKLRVLDGFSELGLPTTSNLVAVINAIRALPLTRPISVRLTINSAARATALHAPIHFLNNSVNAMQIERPQNDANTLLLTYYAGLQATNGLRIFTANHANAVATDTSVAAIVWRETPRLSDGRLFTTQLPTSTVAERVLAVRGANSTPVFSQINREMMAADSVTTGHIMNGSVTNPKIADLAVDNTKIADRSIRQEKLHILEGFAELGIPTNSNLVAVINAIRALPHTRPASVRITINTAAISTAMRAPFQFSSGNMSMIQIERAQNNLNTILLTFYWGLHSANNVRIFTANHANVVATDETVAAIAWRETPLLNNGRLSIGQLPTSNEVNTVLAVTSAGAGPVFTRINGNMISPGNISADHMSSDSVTTRTIVDLAVTNAKIADNTIRQAKLHISNGFTELGIATTSNLVEVINAIRALPLTRPATFRLNITSAAIATALRSPLQFTTGRMFMMQIERAQNNSNALLLTFYSGLHAANNLRIFTANHENVIATDESVAAISWREIPLLDNGRLAIGQLPTTINNHRVLAVDHAAFGPSYMQVNNNMIGDNAINAAKIHNVAALDTNIAIGSSASVPGGDASGNTAIGERAQATIGGNNTVLGANASITGGNHNIAIGSGAHVISANSAGSVAIGRRARAAHVNAVMISPNSHDTLHASQGDNTVTLGNSTTTVGGWSAWTNLSDERDKRDVTPLKYDPLAFVNALKPKQYQTDFRSNYRCFHEISDTDYEALGEYDKHHRVREATVYTIDGTDIEWIEDDCILTNNGRLKAIDDAPDFLEPTDSNEPAAASDRFATKYLCKYTKTKDVAVKKFKDDKCLEIDIDTNTDAFIESCIKATRKAKFRIVALTPDGTYAGKRHHWGFMAQEVEKAAKDMGIDCPAVQYLAHNKDADGIPEGDDLYTMGYTELIAPLVGAVQQLAGMVTALQAEVNPK